MFGCSMWSVDQVYRQHCGPRASGKRDSFEHDEKWTITGVLEYLTIQRLWESLFCHAFPHGTLLDCFDASNGFKPRFRQRNREGLAKHVVERASQSHQLHREDVLNLSLWSCYPNHWEAAFLTTWCLDCARSRLPHRDEGFGTLLKIMSNPCLL